MARIARVIAPGFPHHVTQRGNRRMQTFFSDGDYGEYLTLMAQWCRKFSVDVWTYCLMPNHVHMVVVPESEESLRCAIGEAHRRYSRMINFREGWRGHLWQGRFASFPMDENYLLATVRYVELNPVRAGLVDDPFAYKWSSASAHLNKLNNGLLSASPLTEMIDDWRVFLLGPISEEKHDQVRLHERTGRPLGGDDFISKLEHRFDRMFRRKKPGPKVKI